jgi:hypothetical protein
MAPKKDSIEYAGVNLYFLIAFIAVPLITKRHDTIFSNSNINRIDKNSEGYVSQTFSTVIDKVYGRIRNGKAAIINIANKLLTSFDLFSIAISARDLAIQYK